MSEINAGQITLDIRATSAKLVGDVNRAKASVAGAARSVEKSISTSMTTAVSAVANIGSLIPGVGGQVAGLAGNFQALSGVLPEVAGTLGTVGAVASTAGAAIAAAAVAVGALAVAGVKAASDRQDMLITFEVLLKSKEAARGLVTELKDLADVTPFDTAGLANSARDLLVAGYSAKEISPMLKTLGDAAAASGRGQEGLGRLTYAIQKIKLQGKMQGEELATITDSGVNPFPELQKLTGAKSNAEVRKKMEQGEISGDVAIKAVLASIETQSKGSMDALSKGWKGMFSTLHDKWNEFLVTIGTPILDALSPLLAKATVWVGNLASRAKVEIPKIVEHLKKVYEALRPVREYTARMFEFWGKMAAPVGAIVTLVGKIAAQVQVVSAKMQGLKYDVALTAIEPYLKMWERIAEKVTEVVGKVGKLLGLEAVDPVSEARKNITELEKAYSKLGEKGLEDKATDIYGKGSKWLPILIDSAIVSIDTMIKHAKIWADRNRNIVDNAMKYAKEQAASQANAVIESLKKQYEAYKEHYDKLRAIYDKYVSSSAAIRSRMTGITLESTSKAKEPDWAGMQGNLERSYQARILGQKFVNQYEQATQFGGSTLGKEDNPREMIKELKQMNLNLYKILKQQELSRQSAVLS